MLDEVEIPNHNHTIGLGDFTHAVDFTTQPSVVAARREIDVQDPSTETINLVLGGNDRLENSALTDCVFDVMFSNSVVTLDCRGKEGEDASSGSIHVVVVRFPAGEDGVGISIVVRSEMSLLETDDMVARGKRSDNPLNTFRTLAVDGVGRETANVDRNDRDGRDTEESSIVVKILEGRVCFGSIFRVGSARHKNKLRIRLRQAGQLS